MKAESSSSRSSQAEMQHPGFASITSAPQALMNVHEITRGSGTLIIYYVVVAVQCSGVRFSLRQTRRKSFVTTLTFRVTQRWIDRLIGVLDFLFWNQIIYSRVKSVPFKCFPQVRSWGPLTCLICELFSGCMRLKNDSHIRFRLLVTHLSFSWSQHFDTKGTCLPSGWKRRHFGGEMIQWGTKRKLFFS